MEDMGLFSFAQVIVFVPFSFTFLLQLVWLLTLLLFPGDTNDERADGLLPEPRDGVRLCQGKGIVDGGRDGRIESLENGLGKEACLVRASLGRAGEADGSAAASLSGQGKRDQNYQGPASSGQGRRDMGVS